MRPLTTRQKEFFRFFAIKAEGTLTKREADKFITEKLKELRATKDSSVEQWQAYENVLDEFDDVDFREANDIKKPTCSQIRSAIEALLKDGKSWPEISGDVDLVAIRLLEMKPNLEM